MKRPDPETIVHALVAQGKGILAVDEAVPAITGRFNALRIESTSDSRREFREMFFTTPDIGEYVGGVIMHDETFRQRTATQLPMADLLIQQHIAPGIKVDYGTRPLAGCPGEQLTEGLDGLRERLKNYIDMGARFAKWRAVIDVSDALPTSASVAANTYALARFAAVCEEQRVVPVLEIDVLMDGGQTIERCNEVTGQVLHRLFDDLFDQRASLEAILLSPSMVMTRKASSGQDATERVALATLRCLRSHVPASVPGIVLLCGEQAHVAATLHLNAINQLGTPMPWAVSFSYASALQEEALHSWRGYSENVSAGQRAFYRRARCLSAAALGRYARTMESDAAVA